MFQSTDSRAHFSLMLSEVLDDIGVNERNMKKGRRVFLLIETMQTMTRKSFGFNNILYILGSRSEGTTTIGLESDSDILFCSNDANVIQDRSEWEEGKVNYFMIQDENTTPGYCFLQLFQNDKPLPGTIIPDGYHMTDRRGRILLKNTINTMLDMRVNETREGPSICTQGPHGFNDLDYVLAYPCKSWPKSASGWLERHRISRWPTQDMRRDAASTCCFVVPTGSKAACKFQAPLICTTYGSALASASIGLKHPVSPQALVWLLDGFDSDTSSGRLKLASVFYSEGDMEKTEIILRQTESQFHSFPVSPFCGCRYTMPRPPEATAEFGRFCNKQNEDFVKDIIAFCVRFLKQEINCVPHELQYEMFRSTPDDIKHNNQAKDFWMDLAVVDSLPFLYFLQYKVYRHLHRYKDKKKLLINLQTP
ncbi:uncharacterized protein LOC132733454 isoform X2 [Ruditapes philippinarum]|uniref:uncharacterized protein LOC132733454 isoform X2 n=1 Tax=Ruditapes philippinarum TaxID=129788 RepID=UPI00295B6B22|nr:uncharacterized protein LOC132733454 isoform X2 [Ruditapes philippinarum]